MGGNQVIAGGLGMQEEGLTEAEATVTSTLLGALDFLLRAQFSTLIKPLPASAMVPGIPAA